MRKDVGKVAILPRGEYNATTNYEVLDLVTIDNSVYVAINSSVGKDPSNNPLYWMFLCTGSQEGGSGTAAGFGTPTATIDNSTGTPSVTITATGPNTEKVFNFAFSNLKGVKGDKGDKGDNYTLTSSDKDTIAQLVFDMIGIADLTEF